MTENIKNKFSIKVEKELQEYMFLISKTPIPQDIVIKGVWAFDLETAVMSVNKDGPLNLFCAFNSKKTASSCLESISKMGFNVNLPKKINKVSENIIIKPLTEEDFINRLYLVADKFCNKKDSKIIKNILTKIKGR